MYNSPSVHPWISAEEKHYIESCIGAVDKESMEPTPWLKIITSPHVWAIAVAHFCYNWAEYTLLTCMPTYLADIDILQGTNVSWLKRAFADILLYIYRHIGCGVQWSVLGCPVLGANGCSVIKWTSGRFFKNILLNYCCQKDVHNYRQAELFILLSLKTSLCL